MHPLVLLQLVHVTLPFSVGDGALATTGPPLLNAAEDQQSEQDGSHTDGSNRNAELGGFG